MDRDITHICPDYPEITFEIPAEWPDSAMENVSLMQFGPDQVLIAHPEYEAQIYNFKTKTYRVLSVKHHFTGLWDTLGQPIYVGNIVHWTDGGDELSLEERIKTRWDRIAVVRMENILPHFKVIDSPSKKVRDDAAATSWMFDFNYGSFIWKDTEKYLTVVAQSKEEYFSRFKDAGECMYWVLKQQKMHKFH